jgi:bifunctional non-homologous end joining protein LigD
VQIFMRTKQHYARTPSLFPICQSASRQKQDPWQDYERLRQHITTAMLEMFT